MSLYPSLEDMKVDQLVKAQKGHEAQNQLPRGEIAYPTSVQPAFGSVHPGVPTGMDVALYPSLSEYMGIDLGQYQVQEYQAQNSSGQVQVAPVTGLSVGLQRADIKQGVREIETCKDQKDKIGLRVRAINGGVFIALVHKDSPAALSGLRFGDQILQVNGENMAGYSTDKAMNVLKKALGQSIKLAIRERPFERTITLQKDSSGYVGFVFRDGRIKSLVKDSSAARNGLLLDHQIIEIGGVNCVGLKDKEIATMLDSQGRTVTMTLMPCFLYDHMIKCMGDSLLKKWMDHSVPDL